MTKGSILPNLIEPMLRYVTFLSTFVCALIFGNHIHAQTILEQGDIVIVGVNSNNGGCGVNTEDVITFLCFKDIEPGTTFTITDNGWSNCNNGFWSDNEGVLDFTYSAASTLPSCTPFELRFVTEASTMVDNPDWTVTRPAGANFLQFLNLNSSGDQLYILAGGNWVDGDGGTAQTNSSTYDGDVLFGFNTTSTWVSNCDTEDSELHPNVDPCYFMNPTSGVTNFIKYTGPSGPLSQLEWINLISDPANWTDYSDCTSYNGSSSPSFGCSPSNMSISCSPCSGCGPFLSELTFNLPALGGPFDITYSDGTTTGTFIGASDGDNANWPPTGLITNDSEVILIEVIGANGCPIYANFDGGAVFTVNDQPTIDPIADVTICIGDDIMDYVDINGSDLTGNEGFYSSQGGVDPVISVTVSGTYYAYDGVAGCDDEEAFFITIEDLDAGTNGSIDICDDGSSTTYDLFDQLGGSPDNTGTWSPTLSGGHLGTFDPNTDAAATYTYTVSGSGVACFPVSADVVVTLDQAPDPGMDNTIDLCSNDPSINLIDQLLGTPQGGGSWNPSLGGGDQGTFDPSTDAAGQYTYTVSTSGNCPDESAIVTVSIETAPANIIGGSASVCSGSNNNSLDLIANISGYVAGGTWNDGGLGLDLSNPADVDFSNVTPGGPYDITYTLDGINCNDAVATIMITVGGVPDISVVPPSAICNGEDFTLSDLVVNDNNSNIGTITYHSGTPANNTNEITGNVSPTTSTTYYVLSTTPEGCTDEESFLLDVIDDPMNNTPIVNQITDCLNANGSIEVLPVANSYLYSIDGGLNWDPNNVFTGLSNGTYTVLTMQGICVSSNSFTITIDPLTPPSILTQNTNVTDCGGDDGTITVTPDDPTYEYSIDNGLTWQSSNIFMDLTAGNYDVLARVAATTNCISNLSQVVISEPDAPTNISFEVIQPCNNDGQITINASGTDLVYAIDGLNYQSSNIFDNLSAGNYPISVSVLDAPNCAVSFGSAQLANNSLNANQINLICDGSGGFEIEGSANLTFGNPSNEYFVDYNGISGPFNYGTNFTLTGLPAGQNISISVYDGDNNSCVDVLNLGPLDPCASEFQYNLACDDGNSATVMDSVTMGCNGVCIPCAGINLNCSLSVDIFNPQACDDNGTPSDPSDDLLCFEMNVSAINGGSSGTYDLTIGSNTYGPFSYGILESFCLNADDNTYTFIFTDTDDAGCSNSDLSVTLFTCSSTCDITDAQLNNVICNDNGTPSDDSDDFITFTINPLAFNNGTNYILTANNGNVTPSTGSYGVPSSFDLQTGSAGGGDVTITITDADDATCFINITIPDPGTCSGSCNITDAQLGPIICDDNGTPSDPTDDFLSFELNPIGDNLGATYSVIGPNGSVFPFNANYGSATAFMFDPGSAGAGNVVITIIDNDDASCTIDVTIVDPGSCSSDCGISLVSYTELCNDNGTPADPSDDFYIITLDANASNPGVSNSYTVDFNGIINTFTYGTVNNSFNVPADGNSYTIQIFDTDDNSCGFTQSTSNLDNCSGACGIFLVNYTELCNDNGTPADPSDDFYIINVDADASNPGVSNSYTVDLNGTLNTFTYGTTNNQLSYPADGTTHNIQIYDTDDNSCSINQTSNVLSPCSFDCGINVSVFSFICNDNGTGTDPADDFIEVTIVVDNTNPGPSNEFNVSFLAFTFGPFPYDVGGSFNVPAIGGSFTVNILDEDDPSCATTALLGPLDTCSDECVLTINQAFFSCDDNGTNADPSDDFYTITVNASAINPGNSGQYNVIIGADTFGPFNYNVNGSFTLPADGNSPTLLFEDVNDASCTDQTQIGPLDACSTNCDIDGAASIICNNNNTEGDPSDDFYVITVTATGTNQGASNQYIVSDGINTYGPYDYAIGGIFNLPADGSNINLSFFDVDDNACLDNVSIGPLDPCSLGCSLNILTSEFICDDNNTPSDPTDDFYNILVNAEAFNPGITGEFFVDVGADTYGPFSYNAGGSFTLAADGSNVNLVYYDISINTCSASVNIGPLDNCSSECDIQITQLDWNCNDGGTPNDPSDDQYQLNVNATGNNFGVSENFTVTINNVVYGPFQYGLGGNFLIPADGLSPDAIFEDVDLAGCGDMQNIGPLDACNTNPCSIEENDLEVVCNNNGTPTDPSDDFFTINFNISATNGGNSNQFNVDFESDIYGPFPYDVDTFINVSIATNGLVTDISFFDIDDLSCSLDEALPQLNTCSNDCDFTTSSFEMICNDNGTANDDTDDFYEINFNMILENEQATNNFNIEIGAQTFGLYSSNTNHTLILPADGSSPELSFVEFDNACDFDTIIGPLNPCTDICVLTIDQFTALCNDNGTPNDPLDDFYDITVSASSVNPGSSNSYFISSGFGPFDYGVTEQITYPADGSTVNFIFTDADIPACTDNINFGPFDPCNANCELPVITDVLYSNPNQCGVNDGSIDITATGNNLTYSIDGGITFSSNNVFPDLFDGTYDIIVMSGNDPNCITAWSGPIVLDAPAFDFVIQSNIADPDCDGNPGSIEILIPANIQNAQYSIDGGLTFQSSPLFPSVTNGSYQLVVSVIGDPSCFVMSPTFDLLQPAVPEVNLVSFECFNNGTADPSDDYYRFEFDVFSNNPNSIGSYTTELTNPPTILGSSFYGQNYIVQFLADGTSHGIAFYESDAPGCSVLFNSIPLIPCSDLNFCNENITGTLCPSDTMIIAGSIYDINNLTGIDTVLSNNINECDTIYNIQLTASTNDLIFETIDAVCINDELLGSINIFSLSGAGPYFYSLNNDVMQSLANNFPVSIDNIPPGTGSIFIMDGNQCLYEYPYNIGESIIDYTVSANDITGVMIGDTVFLENSANFNYDQISWTNNTDLSCNDCPIPFWVVTGNQSFSVTYTDGNGCSATGTINVFIDADETKYYIPNMFSPNSDGINDYFTAYSKNASDIILEMHIYNRWGDVIFEKNNFNTNNAPEGWDGTFKGLKLNPDVFVYHIIIEGSDGIRSALSGDVTIIR